MLRYNQQEAEKAREQEERGNNKRKAEEEWRGKRIRSSCSVSGCAKWSRKAGKAKGWITCPGCGKLFCRAHKLEFPPHKKECYNVGVEVVSWLVSSAIAE